MSQFYVDEDNNDDEHFYLDIKGKGSVVIISNQDGVSVDIYGTDGVGDMSDARPPIFSGYVLNSDFDEETWCDICNNEVATHLGVNADNCSKECEKHNLCTACFELGHVRLEES